MKRTLLILAAVPAFSCADVRENTLQITKFIKLSDRCVAEPSAIQAPAFIDIDQGKAMILAFVLRNNLPSNSSEVRLNSNDAQVDSYQVTIAAGNNAAITFAGTKTRTEALVVLTGADQAGTVTAWDAGEGAGLSLKDPTKTGEVLVTVKAIAHLIDGTEIESNDVSTVVSVCQGCLSCGTGTRFSPCGPGFEGVSGPSSCL